MATEIGTREHQLNYAGDLFQARPETRMNLRKPLMLLSLEKVAADVNTAGAAH